MNRDTILEYLRIISITLIWVFFVVVIASFVIRSNVYEDLDKQIAQDEKIEYHMVGVLIQKYKLLEEKYPDQYKINLNLGMFYEIKKEYENSIEQYKIAAEKAPYSEIEPQYKLACLFIRQDELSKAESLMEGITDRPNKELIIYKGDVYIRLGDKYYYKGDYKHAVLAYEKALTYFKFAKKSRIPELEKDIASSYVYLAEDFVKNMQIDEAINSLNIANSIINAPIIKYKLAILLANSKPHLAYRYFNEVFEKEPSLINYENYYNFLSYLAFEAKNNKKVGLSNLYKYKAEKIKKYYYKNILSVDDLQVDYIEGELHYNRFLKRYKINIELRLKNTSPSEIDSLYLSVDLTDGSNYQETFSKRIVDDVDPLKSGSQTAIVNIKSSFPKEKGFKGVKRINATISASKQEKSYKINLADLTINQTKKEIKNLIDLGVIFNELNEALRSSNR